jgi:hypothetical protein
VRHVLFPCVHEGCRYCQILVLVLKVVFAINPSLSSVAGVVEMATIRNCDPAVSKGQWEAQIRRKGYPAQRKIFETKPDAKPGQA